METFHIVLLALVVCGSLVYLAVLAWDNHRRRVHTIGETNDKLFLQAVDSGHVEEARNRLVGVSLLQIVETMHSAVRLASSNQDVSMMEMLLAVRHVQFADLEAVVQECFEMSLKKKNHLMLAVLGEKLGFHVKETEVFLIEAVKQQDLNQLMMAINSVVVNSPSVHFVAIAKALEEAVDLNALDLVKVLVDQSEWDWDQRERLYAIGMKKALMYDRPEILDYLIRNCRYPLETMKASVMGLLDDAAVADNSECAQIIIDGSGLVPVEIADAINSAIVQAVSCNSALMAEYLTMLVHSNNDYRLSLGV